MSVIQKTTVTAARSHFFSDDHTLVELADGDYINASFVQVHFRSLTLFLSLAFPFALEAHSLVLGPFFRPKSEIEAPKVHTLL